MAITKIIYSAATINMGEATERDGENYREWALNQIAAEYPSADISVVDEDMLANQIWSDLDNLADEEREESEVNEFLRGLWDSCPWTGEYFDFRVENVRIEQITDFDMVLFDLVTERGRVELSEHVNYDDEGAVKSVEFSDSNIRSNLDDELCSVFDMSEKPAFMPKIDFVPFGEIIQAVELKLKAWHGRLKPSTRCKAAAEKFTTS